VKELYSYEDKFHQYFRMSTRQFGEILNLIEGDLLKKDTNYREALTPKERLGWMIKPVRVIALKSV
jgi:hypothetical protein